MGTIAFERAVHAGVVESARFDDLTAVATEMATIHAVADNTGNAFHRDLRAMNIAPRAIFAKRGAYRHVAT